MIKIVEGSSNMTFLFIKLASNSKYHNLNYFLNFEGVIFQHSTF